MTSTTNRKPMVVYYVIAVWFLDSLGLYPTITGKSVIYARDIVKWNITFTIVGDDVGGDVGVDAQIYRRWGWSGA